MKLQYLSAITCKELLEFKSNQEIRDRYNSAGFIFSENEKLISELIISGNLNEISLGITAADDMANSKRIFSALKDLDLAQASDKRLWVTLTHGQFFQYTVERWGINSATSNEVIQDRFHFEGSGLRPRNQNSIARLWWGAKLTYDPDSLTPFELTDLLWEKQDFYQNLIDRKFSTYPGILKGFLRFYSENRHLDIKRDMRRLFKGVNALGGVRILPLLTEKEVYLELFRLSKFYKISAASA